MHHRKLAFWFVGVGILFIVTIGIFFLLPAQRVSAQCGSQASSCKNCHETQAQDPVSNDLTTWHGQHAFGDFCYLCHGGNNQSMDKTTAHTGMVDPMTDVAVSCKSCHPKDYETRAQVYANTLGVKISSLQSTIAATENAPAAAAQAAAPSAPAPITPAPEAPAPALSVIPAGSLVDYSQRYNETALGQKPVNTGNIILVVIIVVMLLGGGFFILSREHIIKVSFQETKQIEGSYPSDVVDMVPQIAHLNGSTRANLRKILEKPGTAAEIFALATKLTSTPEPPQEETELEPEEPSED